MANITRRAFIEQNSATCKNWRWSWAFVSRERKRVIFGAWDVLASETSWVILKDEWQKLNGRILPAFSEAKEYIDLVVNEGFDLQVFLMGRDRSTEVGTDSAAKIKSFVPTLRSAKLHFQNGTYFALLADGYETYPDELDENITKQELSFVEGKRRTIYVSAVERSGAARAECISQKGYACRICEMDFATIYGQMGEGFIHVHHVNPISQTAGARNVDPIKDLEPVCPNCHAMVHRRDPPYSIAEMRLIVSERRTRT